MEYYAIIERSLIYIEEFLDEPLSLDRVSGHFNISKYYFHRLFTTILGCSLNQYIMSRRINKAVQWIQETEWPLTQIAFKLNFNDQPAFTRAFKKEMGVPPNHLRTHDNQFKFSPPPAIVKRSFKNLHGDVVTNFTLDTIEPIKIRGIVFEVDLAYPDYKDHIRGYASKLRSEFDYDEPVPSYMIYSNCQPGSSKFKTLFGVPRDFDSDLPNVFSLELPQIFCARFRYSGDLLDIGDVFISDFSRFIQVSRLLPEEGEIELIQVFDPGDVWMTSYEVCVPIKMLKDDVETGLDAFG